MPKAQEFIAYAKECERLAKRLPEHAKALRDIAAAWRRLAKELDEYSGCTNVDGNGQDRAPK
jgi:hypothetical protein